MSKFMDCLKEKLGRSELIKKSLYLIKRIEEKINKNNKEFYLGRRVDIERSNGDIEKWVIREVLKDNKAVVIDSEKKFEKTISFDELRKLNPKFQPNSQVNIRRSAKSGGGIEQWNVVCQFQDGFVLVESPDKKNEKVISARKLKELNS